MKRIISEGGGALMIKRNAEAGMEQRKTLREGDVRFWSEARSWAVFLSSCSFLLSTFCFLLYL